MVNGLLEKRNNLEIFTGDWMQIKNFRLRKKISLTFILKEKGIPILPEATIFVTGSNEWRSFDTWPPKNVD